MILIIPDEDEPYCGALEPCPNLLGQYASRSWIPPETAPSYMTALAVAKRWGT